jgi:MFS family permease
VANVALPDIGTYFDASQTALNLVVAGYSPGQAASVLHLGALGDRHGRKAMALGGVLLSIPAVFCMFPKKQDEQQLLASYHEADTGVDAGRM